MKILIMRGVVERRLLVNYRVDPAVASALLPAPFEPVVVNDHAVAGICLIRLGQLRPQGIPSWFGLTTESAAHRIAVRWSDDGVERTGVYIPRRHTGSWIAATIGDRLFPTHQARASFAVAETDSRIAVAFSDSNRLRIVDAQVSIVEEFQPSGLFHSLAEASSFFRAGSVGYSPRRRSSMCDGLELRAQRWHIEATAIDHVRSSFYDDRATFPPGSIELDSAFVMRNIPVEWHSVDAPFSASYHSANTKS